MERRSFFAAAGATALGATLLSIKASAQSMGKVDAKLAELAFIVHSI